MNRTVGPEVIFKVDAHPDHCYASVEENNLIATFPTGHPAYRVSTKMLIPFVR